MENLFSLSSPLFAPPTPFLTGAAIITRMQNKEIRFASRPTGMPTGENFQIVDTDVPTLNDDEMLVRTLYISVDPYLRGRMREGRSYIAPFEVGQVIESGGVGEVVESRSPKFQTGDNVTGNFGWRLFNVAKTDGLMKVAAFTEPVTSSDSGEAMRPAPISLALGILGMPGLTAYFGLLDIGKPKTGETVVVSGAAGAVGTTVCQIAKIKGCRTVGIAGSDEKNQYLRDELGVDAVINYKTDDVRKALAEASPNGIDVYFDNVGGEVSDAVMPLLNNGARIIICGQISLYNLDKPDVGPRPQPYVLVTSSLMQGFIITSYAPRFSEGVMQLARWLAEGKLKYAETVVEGFENTPQAFIGLFSGDNLGKQIVKVAD
ncbi:MAG TPA: NADP-dependent oxidoreductase [Pyrinomonadaceae bacterium]|nr:NADP-dependent oxidoreductase [Pyrinomonadaceae bacterium]